MKRLPSIIETCKLNKVEPHAYMTDVLTAIAQGHKQKYINSYSRGTLVTEAPLTVFLPPHPICILQDIASLNIAHENVCHIGTSINRNVWLLNMLSVLTGTSTILTIYLFFWIG